MRKGAKRTARTDEDAPVIRRRLSDRVEEEKEKLQKQQQSDEEWEEVSDDEDDDSDISSGVDEPLDEAIEEEIIEDAADDDDDDDDDDDEEDEDYAEFQRETESLTKGMRRVTFDDAALQNEDEEDAAPTVWRSDQAESGELQGENQQLEYSNKAYDSFFQLRTEYPCLSFDVVKDNESGNRSKYPLSLTLVCGSQADDVSKNQLYVLRITNICRTKHDADSDSDSDASYIGDEGESEEDEDAEAEEVNNGEPIVQHRIIPHYGTANRVRCAHHNPNLVAVWSDAGHVQVFDIATDVEMLCDHAGWARRQSRVAPPSRRAPLLFCTPGATHRTEGYGLDWSPVAAGVFASGDCDGSLYVWQPTEDGRWRAAASSTGGPTAGGERPASVEEIQWSPTQAEVLIATRVGGVVEVWDTRDMRRRRLGWQADSTDINVADWNTARQASHLLATGADSGAVAVWDLRRVADKTGGDTTTNTNNTNNTAVPIQQLPWHRGSITSVEFSRHNESVLAVTGDDGQCTLWDLSLERDPSEEKEVIGELFGRQDLIGIPDQLMFQHQGLQHAKEAHWHSQIPGMVITTDYAGLHLFRPMNWRSLMK